MVFQFFKNHSDNRKVNKNIEKIAVGESTITVPVTDIIPRVSQAVSNITSSSNYSGYNNWCAFSSTMPQDLRNPEYDSCWTSDSNDNNPFILYEFDNAKNFNKVKINCFSNYSGDFTGSLVIECSNDNINYSTLYEGNITGELQTMTSCVFTFENENDYKYLKISFNRCLLNPYEPSLFIASINADGLEAVTTPIYNINVIYKDDETKDNPTLEMAYSAALIHANYAYCVDTGYYFYLSEPTLAAQRLFFNCEVDLLMTYKNDILKLGCIIDRQEYEFNAYLVDDKAPILNRRVVNTLKFPTGFSNNDSYILATTGI